MTPYNNEYEEYDLNMLDEDPSVQYVNNPDVHEAVRGLEVSRGNHLFQILSENGILVKIKNYFPSMLHLLLFIYVCYAGHYWYSHTHDCNLQWCNGFGLLLILVLTVYSCILYSLLIKKCLKKLTCPSCKPFQSIYKICQGIRPIRSCFKIIFYLLFLIPIMAFVIYDTMDCPERLISIGGILAMITFGWIFSRHPTRVNWRIVISGLIIQSLLGLITIRWSVGRVIFQCIASKVDTFLSLARAGASFAYSDFLVYSDTFAFTALPPIFFFGAVIQMLYHCGILEKVISNVGWVIYCLMGITSCESVNAACNTFLGMTESVLLIRPYMNTLTSSELHTIMCSGFASISALGTTLAAYVGFGAQPCNLITATLMGAPAALAFSKLFYPETEKSKTTFEKLPVHESEDSGLLDAAVRGALNAIPVVLGITASMIAFTSMVEVLDALLQWSGLLVGLEDLSLELIFSTIFTPISWLMGVPWKNCGDVGHLIGLKLGINEFIAYQKLGEYKLEKEFSPRTEAIATFAICGFSNPAAVGTFVSALMVMIPEKKVQVADVALRAAIAGGIIPFITAATVGILMDDHEHYQVDGV